MDITQLLTFAIDNDADQAVISAGSPPVLRKEGKLVFTKMDALTGDDTHDLIYPALGPTRVEQLEKDREIHFTHQLREDRQCLVSVYFERGHISAVFRIAPPAAALPTKLGLPSLVAEACRASQGLVVLASPPGHGKSTALASLVELINSEREATILTIEKRIIHPHVDRKSVIHQREVGRDALSFSSALEWVGDQDPDVLVIDPMNEPETIRQALAFAGRGRLVLASLEADYVLEALEKLMSGARAERVPNVSRQVGASLLLVAAIRLLPRKDGPGRVPATEVLRVDAEVARLIRQGDTKALAKHMTSPEEAGTWTLDSFILKLTERGLVEEETARRYLLDVKAMES